MNPICSKHNREMRTGGSPPTYFYYCIDCDEEKYRELKNQKRKVLE